MITVTHVMSQEFAQGMALGCKRIFRTDLSVGDGTLYFAPGEEGILDIAQNLIYTALDGKLTDEQLRRDLGIIVGYAVSHPSVFRVVK